MKHLFYIAFLFFAASANCQETSINFTDSLGRKQGHWIIYAEDRPESGIPAGGKVEEGDYLNDKKEGLWIKYHDDGKTPKIKGTYHNNRPDGRYEKYWDTGFLREKGCFSKNQCTSDSVKRFFRSGQLEYEAWYNENGKEHGRVNFFYENGQLEYSYIANNGVPTEVVHYDQSGKLIPGREGIHSGEIREPVIYEKSSGEQSNITPPTKTKAPVYPPQLTGTPDTRGKPFKPDGYNEVYNGDDEIWLDGMFVNGQLYNGKQYVYDRDGILLNVRIFKDGVYHSDGQI